MLYGRKLNSLTNCRVECAHLTITVSQIERNIGRKSSFFHTPFAFDAPVRGVSVGLAPFRLARKKLEWLGYQMVKKFRRYLYSFWRNSRTWQDRRTDRHRVPAIAALMHSIARQKLKIMFIPRLLFVIAASNLPYDKNFFLLSST